MQATKKDDKTKNIVCLRKGIHELFRIYPKSFNKASKGLLETLAKKMRVRLSIKICLTKSTLIKKIILDFMRLIFLEKFVTLYDLLKNLVTSKISIDNAIADEIYFIINLMTGYDKTDLFAKKIKTHKKKSDSWENEAIDKANETFYNSYKKFFSKNVKHS